TDQAIDAIIADYLAAVEAGDAPDRQQLLERYPEHAAELGEFLDAQDELRLITGVSPPIQRTGGSTSGSVGRSNSLSVGENVRYFGDYELQEEIARGGMGIVYKARQVSLNRTVALKMILAGQ